MRASDGSSISIESEFSDYLFYRIFFKNFIKNFNRIGN